MDSVVLGALIGGVAGIIFSWGSVLIFHLIRRHVARPKKQVDQSGWEPMFGRPVSDWYRVWAWKPVHTLDRGWIWLRPYWRRRIYKKQFLHGGADFWWQNIVVVTYVAD
ncbi:hypothetical protein PBI_SHEPARD_87 [Arthrobacter phage Shepard]|nr:hypothetical protein PBI_SHEPARD_87 [Arthrobacter phage Shepard]